VGWAIVITVLGLITRMLSLYRNARIKPKSSAETAIGVRHPNIRQTSQGAMGGSFNTREFFHHKSAGFVKTVKWFFILFTFLVPVILLLLGQSGPSAVLLIAAVATQYLGLIAERWFFFAQANHPQNIYYAAT